eukprot:365718-Chlamydomonas_euryale.AAC.29
MRWLTARGVEPASGRVANVGLTDRGVEPASGSAANVGLTVRGVEPASNSGANVGEEPQACAGMLVATQGLPAASKQQGPSATHAYDASLAAHAEDGPPAAHAKDGPNAVHANYSRLQSCQCTLVCLHCTSIHAQHLWSGGAPNPQCHAHCTWSMVPTSWRLPRAQPCWLVSIGSKPCTCAAALPEQSPAASRRLPQSPQT